MGEAQSTQVALRRGREGLLGRDVETKDAEGRKGGGRALQAEGINQRGERAGVPEK